MTRTRGSHLSEDPTEEETAWVVMANSPVGRLLVGGNAKGVFAIEFDTSGASLRDGTARAARADAGTQTRYQRLRVVAGRGEPPRPSRHVRAHASPSPTGARRGKAAATAHAQAAARQLEEYFAGKRKGFDLDLHLTGTDFEERVWRELAKIPHGQTRTYAQIARAAGKPGAARAAGGAIGRNPAAIVVPCHRVVGSSGSLTGFGGGLDRKRWLLDHESGARRLPASAT